MHCQGLHYPPSLLVATLLMAHHRRTAMNSSSQSVPGMWNAHTGNEAKGHPSNAYGVLHLEGVSNSAGNTEQEQDMQPIRVSHNKEEDQASSQIIEAPVDDHEHNQYNDQNSMTCRISRVASFQNSDKPLGHQATAVCEGLDRIRWNPGLHDEGTLSQAQPDEGLYVQSDPSQVSLQLQYTKHEQHSSGLQNHRHSPAVAAQGAGLLSFLRARERVIHEMKRLKDAQNTVVPEPKDFLAGLLCAFSIDVLRSQLMCAAAYAVLANSSMQENPSASPKLSDSGVQQGRAQLKGRPVTSFMSNLTASGMLNALDVLDPQHSNTAKTLVQDLEESATDDSAQIEHTSSSISLPGSDCNSSISPMPETARTIACPWQEDTWHEVWIRVLLQQVQMMWACKSTGFMDCSLKIST